MPICARTPAFTRISLDSRPIVEEGDLRRVFTADRGLDLRAQALTGRALLFHLEAQPDNMRAVCMSWLMAFRPAKEVSSRGTAEEFVRAEEARWAGTGPGPSFADDWEKLSCRYLCEVFDRRKIGNTDHGPLLKNLRAPGGVVFGYWQYPSVLNEPDAAAAKHEDDAWEFEHYWVIRPLHDFSKSLPGLWIMVLM